MCIVVVLVMNLADNVSINQYDSDKQSVGDFNAAIGSVAGGTYECAVRSYEWQHRSKHELGEAAIQNSAQLFQQQATVGTVATGGLPVASYC